MPLTLAEYKLRQLLPRRLYVLMLFDAACLLDWTTIKSIAELAEVSYDKARVELGRLVRDGWLVREVGERHKRASNLVRFTPRIAALRHPPRPIPQDRSSTSTTDPTGSVVASRPIPQDRSSLEGSRARPDPDPDLSGSKIQDQRVRPSGEGVQGETHARTDGSGQEVRPADVQWIAEQWTVSTIVARRLATKLVDELKLDRRLLRTYLGEARDGKHAAFKGLHDEKYPLALACTRERLDPWLASRARRRPSPPATVREQLERPIHRMPAHDEMSALSVLVRRAMRSEK